MCTHYESKRKTSTYRRSRIELSEEYYAGFDKTTEFVLADIEEIDCSVLSVNLNRKRQVALTLDLEVESYNSPGNILR